MGLEKTETTRVVCDGTGNIIAPGDPVYVVAIDIAKATVQEESLSESAAVFDRTYYYCDSFAKQTYPFLADLQVAQPTEPQTAPDGTAA